MSIVKEMVLLPIHLRVFPGGVFLSQVRIFWPWPCSFGAPQQSSFQALPFWSGFCATSLTLLRTVPASPPPRLQLYANLRMCRVTLLATLYLMDVVPDGEVRFGFPNIADNAEIVEMMASGAHLTLFVTGRGSVVGSALGPVIKICANPETWATMADDMDINAGAIIEGIATLDHVAEEILTAL